MKLIKVGDKLFELKDDRLSPMTYSKLKEMGYTSEDWKDWDQEHANKVVAQGRQEENKKQGSEEGHNEKSSSTESQNNSNNIVANVNTKQQAIDHINSITEESVRSSQSGVFGVVLHGTKYTIELGRTYNAKKDDYSGPFGKTYMLPDYTTTRSFDKAKRTLINMIKSSKDTAEQQSEPSNEQISKQLSSKNLDKKGLINLYKQIDPNDVITVKNSNQHFEYIPKGDGKYAIKLHNKNGTFNGGQTTLSEIMQEHWKWIDPDGFYAENVTVNVTSKAEAEEQNRLQQTAESNPGRENIKISQSQKNSLQKYADRFEYNWQDIYDGINYRVTVMGMGVQEAVNDIKETMVAGEDLF